MKFITVFTPTYNRAYCLGKLYNSLINQSNQNFIWLLIDDGSTDKTKELVQLWIDEAKIEIQYIYQKNQGMHGAHNTAYENITTELNICIDSDDFMPNDAISDIYYLWKENKSEKYAGIVGLDIDINNNVIGTEFNKNIKEITLTEFYRKGGKGDKKLVYKTDVINKYPKYPIFENEKYVSLGYKYLLIDQDYKLLILNKPIVVVEYRIDGSSLNMFNQYLKNPKGFAFIRKVNMKYSRSPIQKFKECIHYVSSSIISKNIEFLKESPLKIYTCLAIPFGICLYFYVSLKTKIR